MTIIAYGVVFGAPSEDGPVEKRLHADLGCCYPPLDAPVPHTGVEQAFNHSPGEIDPLHVGSRAHENEDYDERGQRRHHGGRANRRYSESPRAAPQCVSDAKCEYSCHQRDGGAPGAAEEYHRETERDSYDPKRPP